MRSKSTTGYTPGAGISLQEIPQSTLLRDLYAEKTFFRNLAGQSILTTDKNYVESVADILRRLNVALYLLEHIHIDVPKDSWVFYAASFIRARQNVMEDKSIENYAAIMRIEKEKHTLRTNLVVAESELYTPATERLIDESIIKLKDVIEFMEMMLDVENYLNRMQLDVVKLNMAMIINLKKQLRQLKTFFGIDQYLTEADAEEKKRDAEIMSRSGELEEDDRLHTERVRAFFGADMSDLRMDTADIECEQIVDGVRVVPATAAAPMLSIPKEPDAELHEMLGTEKHAPSALKWRLSNGANAAKPSDEADLVWRLEMRRAAIEHEDFIWSMSHQKKQIPSFIFNSIRTLMEVLEAQQQSGATISGDQVMKTIQDIKREFVGIGKLIFDQLAFLRNVDLSLYIEIPRLNIQYTSNLDISFKEMHDDLTESQSCLEPYIDRHHNVLAFLASYWMSELVLKEQRQLSSSRARIRFLYRQRSEEEQKMKRAQLRYDQTGSMVDLDSVTALKKKIDHVLTPALENEVNTRKRHTKQLEHQLTMYDRRKTAAKMYLHYDNAVYLEKNQVDIIINGDTARASHGGVAGSTLYVNPKNIQTDNIGTRVEALKHFYFAFTETIAMSKPSPAFAPASAFKRIKVL